MRFDYLFLENIGNLVCPVDFDTGAHLRVMLLSVPEGYESARTGEGLDELSSWMANRRAEAIEKPPLSS